MFFALLLLCLAAWPVALHAITTDETSSTSSSSPTPTSATTFASVTAIMNPLPAPTLEPTLDGPIITTYVTATATAPASPSTLDEPATTTFVTATGAPPSSATAASVPTACQLGVKLCERPRVEISCSGNKHCNGCVWYNRRFRTCKWWLGDDTSDLYGGEGCADPNWFCVDFENTGYETEKDLACSQVHWGDWSVKIEMECGDRWDPYRNEKPPDVPGTNWACDVVECNGLPGLAWTAYAGPSLGYGNHPKPTDAPTDEPMLRRR